MTRLLRLVFVLSLAILASAWVTAIDQKENRLPLDIPKNIQPYFVALLVKGDHYSAEQTPESMELLRQHLSYIRLQTENKIYLFAGPFTDDGTIAGMIVLRRKSRDEAEAVLNQDPAVKAGQFKIQLHSAMFAEIESVAKY
jgi:uncharacterized protein YciI